MSIHKLLSMVPRLVQSTGPLTDKLRIDKSDLATPRLPISKLPQTTTTSVCGFCSTGCGLHIHLRDSLATGLTPAQDYPVNLGMACPKGWEALNVLQSDDRATVPVRRELDGRLRPISWQLAVQELCDNFKRIQQDHGTHAVAFISTGQIPSEEMFFLGCLAKFGMGVLHGDGNTRQCMATSVAAYKQAFGFDAPPFSYRDLEESDVLVFVGANPCVAHPILWQRVLANSHQPEMIVVDPRCTETAMAATEHVNLKPKSDLTLLYGLAKLLIDSDWIDHKFIERHTQNFEAFRQHVDAYDLARVSDETGISRDQLVRVASKIASGQRVSMWWTMGVNQSHQGVATAQAIINLCLMTGNIGRPGTGPNSITGQCNAMGSRLFSNTTNLVGHHDFTSKDDREKIAALLDIPLEKIPVQNSWAYDQILQGIEDGHIRGLWIVATNTAHSWINSARAQRLLGKLEYLVVQDMYSNTETAEQANLLLPAAGWGEKEGTFINSERRIGVTRRVMAPPGQALPDFEIFRLIAEAWGCGSLFSKWNSPATVFEMMKRVSAGQSCDITGISNYEMLDQCGGVQWPWTSADSERFGAPTGPKSERRLFEDNRFYHTDGRARFIFTEPHAPLESPDAEYPLWLLTGRGSVSQWHTETRTRKSQILRQLSPQRVCVEMHPADAERLNLTDGQSVEICSRRGKIVVHLQLTSAVGEGQVFLPMHSSLTNQITIESVDPISRQPSYKACAVRIVAHNNHARRTRK